MATEQVPTDQPGKPTVTREEQMLLFATMSRCLPARKLAMKLYCRKEERRKKKRANEENWGKERYVSKKPTPNFASIAPFFFGRVWTWA